MAFLFQSSKETSFIAFEKGEFCSYHPQYARGENVWSMPGIFQSESVAGCDGTMPVIPALESVCAKAQSQRDKR